MAANEQSTDRASVAGGVANRLRASTREIHARAESAGVVRMLLSGTASRTAYLHYLRNLQSVYECLEDELRTRSCDPRWRTLAAPEVYRAGPMASDLAAVAGESWPERYPLVRATERYRERIRTAAATCEARLAGHAYTRYLGDLSGGRVLATLVARSLGLAPGQLRTYRFESVADLVQFKAVYRRAFDAWGDAEAELLDEAYAAFELNIALAEEVGSLA